MPLQNSDKTGRCELSFSPAFTQAEQLGKLVPALLAHLFDGGPTAQLLAVAAVSFLELLVLLSGHDVANFAKSSFVWLTNARALSTTLLLFSSVCSIVTLVLFPNRKNSLPLFIALCIGLVAGLAIALIALFASYCGLCKETEVSRFLRRRSDSGIAMQRQRANSAATRRRASSGGVVHVLVCACVCLVCVCLMCVLSECVHFFGGSLDSVFLGSLLRTKASGDNGYCQRPSDERSGTLSRETARLPA